MFGTAAEETRTTRQRVNGGLHGASERGVATFELMLLVLIGILLLTISMPALLRTVPRANDPGARANLLNAVVAAKAAYFVNQSFSWEGSPLSALSFEAQDPAFSWTTGSCAGKSPNCVSVQVVNVNSPGDSQGVVVAVWSSVTKTCWLAADLESVPNVLREDRSGVAFESRSTIHGSHLAAGVYYARSEAGASTCSAGSAAISRSDQHWGSSLAAPGVVG